ncbi:MAG: hypothetical protein ABIG67_02800 [Pseudomonadota bacterium]
MPGYMEALLGQHAGFTPGGDPFGAFSPPVQEIHQAPSAGQFAPALASPYGPPLPEYGLPLETYGSPLDAYGPPPDPFNQPFANDPFGSDPFGPSLDDLVGW